MAAASTGNMKNYKMPGQRGPMNRGKEVEKAKNQGATLKRLFSYFLQEKTQVIFLFIAVLLTVVCTVLAPRYQSNAIDAITVREFDQIPGTLLVMGICYGCSVLGGFIQGRAGALLSQRIVRRLREEFFEKIVKLPIRYLDNHSHGDIMSRMTNDVENISSTVSQSISSLFSGVLTVLGTAGMMFYLCPVLALLSCTTVILTGLATKYLSLAMRKNYVKRQGLLGSLNGVVEEKVRGFHTVAAYGDEQRTIDEFERISDELTEVGIKAEILGGSMGPVMNFINNAGFVIIAAFGGYFAIRGVISVGIISAFIIYAKQFGRPIDEIAQVWGQIQTAIAGAERVFEIMDEEPENRSGDVRLDSLGKEIRIDFEHVDFSYEPGKKVLTDFNLSILPGQKIALVGATGSGKTTAVNLLMRFYEPDSGVVRINGVDILDLDLKDLRDHTAIVLQDTVLFADTVRNNLKYANAECSDEEMLSYAKESHVDWMVRGLEHGYDTILTAGGENLSAGQRQLIAIARAFISKPDILILDEATSSVDTRTEKRIQDAMHRLMKGRTSVIIAHRLSTVRDADRIIVLDRGKIVETGTHQELLERKGRYAALYETQFAGQAI